VTTRYPEIPQEQRADLAAKYTSGLSFIRLAGIYRTSESQVRKALALECVPLRPAKRTKASKHVIAQILQMYQQGESIKSLAERFNLSDTTVWNYLVKAGCQTRSRGGSGARRGLGAQAFTLEEKEQICTSYKSGLSTLEIGKQFGSDHSTIAKVLRACGIELRPKGGLHDTIQALLLGKGSFASKRHCSFYVFKLDLLGNYCKPGIAFDVEQRAEDLLYQDELMRIEFASRAEAYLFEQAVLSATEAYANCPKDLLEAKWAGYREIRDMDFGLFESICVQLLEELGELGVWEFGARYVQMTESQRAAFMARAASLETH
jgi:DNA invertase Pin-like site-specific DNA recombinase